MRKIITKKITHYILDVKCKCKRKNQFLITTGNRIPMKKLLLNIPHEWNGWIVKEGEEQCPICIMTERNKKSKTSLTWTL